METPRFYSAKVSQIIELAPTVKHFVLDYPPDADTHFTPGQFIMLHLQKDGLPHRKSYSIASSPSLKNKIELSVKLVEEGYVTNYLFKLKEGAILHTSLPYGLFMVQEPWQDNLIFVATGTGIAPIRSMIKNLYEKKCDRTIWLIFGNRYESEILYLDEWRALEKKYKNFRFIPTISRSKEWPGEKAYVQEVVKKTFAGQNEGLDFYGCGLLRMCRDLKATLIEMNIPKERVHFEAF